MSRGFLSALILLAMPAFVAAQQNPVPPTSPPPRAAAAQPPAARIPIAEAIRLALQHNHALQAARTAIFQSQAMETTANLRPNPVLSWDCLLYTSPSPRDRTRSRMPSSA